MFRLWVLPFYLHTLTFLMNCDMDAVAVRPVGDAARLPVRVQQRTRCFQRDVRNTRQLTHTRLCSKKHTCTCNPCPQCPQVCVCLIFAAVLYVRCFWFCDSREDTMQSRQPLGQTRKSSYLTTMFLSASVNKTRPLPRLGIGGVTVSQALCGKLIQCFQGAQKAWGVKMI